MLVLALLSVEVLVTVVIVAITSSTKGSDSGICNSKTNVQVVVAIVEPQ